MPIHFYLFAVGVILFTLVAAVTDYRRHRIPNYVTVPAAILGLLFHLIWPVALGGFWTALFGFLVGFALLLLPWLMGGGGMGDVKLLAALGTWFGPYWILITFATSVLIAAAAALVIVAVRGKKRALGNSAGKSGGGAKGTTGRKVRILPFAMPVAIGAWVVTLYLLQKGGLKG